MSTNDVSSEGPNVLGHSFLNEPYPLQSYDVQRKVAVSLIDAARAGTLSTVAGLIEKGGVSPDFQESEVMQLKANRHLVFIFTETP